MPFPVNLQPTENNVSDQVSPGVAPWHLSFLTYLAKETIGRGRIGGYIIGVAVALFGAFSGLSPEWRLFVITGFCGGLTTFSTFSSELVAHLQEGRPMWACGAAAAHLLGSVLMTLAGIATVSWFRSWGHAH
jgi:CrcB protein